MTLRREVKITLVEQALQSNFARKKANRVTIRQFVNRLLLLLQEPRIFLFYEKEMHGDLEKWKYVFDTHKDVFYSDRFNETVLSKVNNTKNYYIKPPTEKQQECSYLETWPTAPLELGGTGFGIIVVAIESDGRSNVKFITPIISHNDKIIYNEDTRLLRSLWNRFFDCKFSEALGVEKKIKEGLEQIKLTQGGRKKTFERIEETQFELNKNGSDRAFLDLQLGLLTNIINRLYKDLSKTPLIRNKDKIPPNLFFFVRYYDIPETINRSHRKGKNKTSPACPYSLKIIIPPLQREDLASALKIISDSKRDRKKEYWLYRYDGVVEKNSCFPDGKLDDEFWDEFETAKKDKKTKEVIEKMIDELQEPFGKGARSFVDPALASGYIHFKKGVYKSGGAERLDETTRDMGFESVDVKRQVYLHYLLSASAPSSSFKNLSTTTIPLNVQNEPYVAIVQSMIDEKSDKANWPRNYHFFSDIARHCVRKLRYYSRREFRKQVELVFFDTFKNNIKLKKDGYLDVPFEIIKKELNHAFLLLCRVWSYQQVFVVFLRGEHDPKCNLVSMFDSQKQGIVVNFKCSPNPYFGGGRLRELKNKSVNDNFYISEEDVGKNIRNAVLKVNEFTNRLLKEKIKDI